MRIGIMLLLCSFLLLLTTCRTQDNIRSSSQVSTIHYTVETDSYQTPQLAVTMKDALLNELTALAVAGGHYTYGANNKVSVTISTALNTTDVTREVATSNILKTRNGVFCRETGILTCKQPPHPAVKTTYVQMKIEKNQMYRKLLTQAVLQSAGPHTRGTILLTGEIIIQRDMCSGTFVVIPEK